MYIQTWIWMITTLYWKDISNLYILKLNHCLYLYCSQELEAYKNQMDFTEGTFVSSEDSNVYAGLDVDHFKPVTKVHTFRRLLSKMLSFLSPGRGNTRVWKEDRVSPPWGISISNGMATVSAVRNNAILPKNCTR
jgi:hypothetical protein